MNFIENLQESLKYSSMVQIVIKVPLKAMIIFLNLKEAIFLSL